MKSFNTQIREKIKNLLLLFDYIFWLLIDPSKFKKIRKKKIKKVIIIHFGAIGELLLSTILFPALKKALNCEISFMVSEGKEAIFKNNPYISETLVDKKNFKKNINILKEKDFDLAIILFPASFKNSLMCLIAGIPYRIGGFSGLNGLPSLFYTRRTFPINKKHVVEKNLEVIRQIGINNQTPKIEFYISKKNKKSAKEKLDKYKIKNYVIIHPGFGFSRKYKYPTKFWPAERYAEVADYLIEKYKVKVLLTGGENEKILSDEIKKKIKNKEKIVVTNGFFNFEELGYIVSKSKLLIGPSTSITHLAEAFEIPIVELAGKGTLHKISKNNYLYEWHPWVDKEKYRVLYHNEVCTGCNLMNCKKKIPKCMLAITSKEVINASKEVIKD